MQSINSILILICVKIIVGVTASDNTIAFSVVKGERNGPYISYQTMLANNSALFNPLYGVFMCTEPGIYYFSFNLLSHENQELRVSLRVNRIPMVTAYSGSKSSFNMATGSAIIQLELNDIVYCFVEEGDFFESQQINRAFTSFSGFKIGGTTKPDEGFFSNLIGRQSRYKDRINGSTNIESRSLNDYIDSNDNIYDYVNTFKSNNSNK